jgi:hypothetical protein
MKRSEAPHCCDNPMTPIVYGMPGPELVEASMRGAVELGGCVISDDAPMFRCDHCGRTVGRLGLERDEHVDDDRR